MKAAFAWPTWQVDGDVNREALVLAGGDVLVWGRLQGEVHAGRNKHQGASVSMQRVQGVLPPRSSNATCPSCARATHTWAQWDAS